MIPKPPFAGDLTVRNKDGFSPVPAGTRFWTAINDQPANPWN